MAARLHALSGEEAVESFSMGLRQAAKAWTGTAMLARVLHSRVVEVAKVFEAGTAKDVSVQLAEIARGALDGHGATHSQDVGRAMELGRLVVQAAAGGLKAVEAADRVEELIEVLKGWIARGRADGAPDLVRIDSLVGGEPAIRLSLLAPYAPAVAMAAIVLRARRANYPFIGGAAVPQEQPA